MSRTARAEVAPLTRAASSSCGPIWAMLPNMTRTPTGNELTTNATISSWSVP